MQKRMSHIEDEVLTCLGQKPGVASWCLSGLTMTGDMEGDFLPRPIAASPRHLVALYFGWEGCHQLNQPGHPAGNSMRRHM